MAKKSLLSRIFDVDKTKNRAAFSDVENKITKYHYGSDAFMQILESRYSCHSFSSYPVQESKLQMILEAGRLAPSAGNNQPTRIWVVKSEEALAMPLFSLPILCLRQRMPALQICGFGISIQARCVRPFLKPRVTASMPSLQ